jgi:manganese/zinc/iron transport system permease protein
MGLAYNTLVVLIGTGLLGANAGLVGSFAVLRGRALTGDALAHAALPGLCLAFLLTGERSVPILLAGALVSGLLGVAVISGLRRWTRIREDAAIGIVLSVFFGAGIALSGIIQKRSSEGSKAGLDSYILGKTAGILAADVYWIAGVSAVSVVAIGLLYKEFKVTVFDPEFGRVQGWPVGLLDLALMGLVALAVVVGLPTVGVVLMAAMLILPGASARFWTDRLGPMLGVAAVLGLGTGLVGTWLSSEYSGMPAGPIIVLVGSTVFGLSALLAPRRGLLSRVVEARGFRRELDDRTFLATLFDLSEPGYPASPSVPLSALEDRRSWSPARLQSLADRAGAEGWVDLVGPDMARLTPKGLARGAELARGQRLWERFLHDYPELASSLADLSADSIDDRLPRPLVAELETRLLASGRWPKGAPLPRPEPEEDDA